MLLKDWPVVAREYPAARLRHDPLCHLSQRGRVDAISLAHARRIADREANRRCGVATTTWTKTIFQSYADYTAVSSTNSEASLLAGVNQQPVIPGGYFDGTEAVGRSLLIEAMGVLGTTSTPTIIFQVRLGTTAGSSYLSGTSVGVTAAITTGSGVSNQLWFLKLLLTCRTPGIGAGNTTLSGAGFVQSGGGFASPFTSALEPTTPPTATWTATMDNSVTNYVNLSCTWSASSSSNTATLKSLTVLGLN